MKIIAFGHKSRVGKNEAANILFNMLIQSKKSVHIVSFAALLKDICYTLFWPYGLQKASYYEDNPKERHKILPGLDLSPVSLWIKFGMDMRLYNQDVWVKNVFDRAYFTNHLIITDLRFLNEAKAVKDRNGIIIKIERDIAPIFNSPADNALQDFNDWDYVIKNNRSLEDLRKEVEKIYVAITSVE